MKKYIFLLISTIYFTISYSQTFTMTNPNGNTLDTVTNTTAEGPTVDLKGKVDAVGFGIELVSIDGTFAGKVYLQAATRSGQWLKPYLDSVVYDVNNAKIGFQRTSPGYRYFRLLVAPTTTNNTSYRATGYIRNN
ncbi:MAG TPA: hypothetical protein VEA37_02210 [Flavobacterium sp.]|nr:hypothetical protein [Flavobacterium sp.]